MFYALFGSFWTREGFFFCIKDKVLIEPSCGVGNFIGMIPDSMAGSHAYGVELDSISGRIAQQLYQNSSIAVTGFEKVQMPDSFFDVAIGNVPFGDFKVLDKRYDKHHWLIHDYFFGKTLDKVRPGGIVAFITSKALNYLHQTMEIGKMHSHQFQVPGKARE